MTPAVERFLAAWHSMVASGDFAGVGALLAPDIVFRSPVVYSPYHGAERAALVLQTAATVFENFRYHRAFVEGDSIALEFSARIGAVELKGVDLVRLGADGRVVEFEVLVRPATGLQALAQAMARRLEGRL
jgi:hypothetical protein